MVRYEWRVSLLDGTESLRVSGQGLWIGDEVFAWNRLSDVAFVRYHTRGGVHEEFSLCFGPDGRRKLRWMGSARNRAPWREMMVAVAREGARKRPDLTVSDGPDAQESRTVRWIGLGVCGVALTIMGVTFSMAESFVGGLAGAWIGVVGCVVGGLIFGHYKRRGAPPRLDWAAFAAREGQEGNLPPN